MNHSDYDFADNTILDVTKRCCRRKFQEKVNECIDQLGIEELANMICNSRIGLEIDR